MGQIRIVGGSLRRRRIRVPDGGTVRPTSDRAREALFDILGPDVEAARVLDAFAGSGALGLEAASRGAAHVTFVERDPSVATILRQNIDALGVKDRCEIVTGTLDLALRSVTAPYALVLADPPYAMDPVPFLRAIALPRVLDPEARVVLERDARSAPAVITELSLLRSARYGRTRLDFYRWPGPRPDAVEFGSRGT